MSQTRHHSLLESVANVVVGLGVSFAANATVLPALGYNITVQDNILLGVIFTAISIVRSYTMRRIFNRITHRRNRKFENAL